MARGAHRAGARRANGVKRHIDKFPLVVEPLAQNALFAHAAFFHDAAGGGIVQLVLRLDAVDIHRVKCVINHAPERFGHVAAVPHPLGQRIADFHAGVVHVVIHVADGADQAAGFFIDDAPTARLVGAVAAGHVAAIILGLADVLLRRPEHVARHVRVAAVFKNILRVLHGHAAQGQARGFQRRHGEKAVFVRGKHIA